jgi:SecD/SecF fusion protein
MELLQASPAIIGLTVLISGLFLVLARLSRSPYKIWGIVGMSLVLAVCGYRTATHWPVSSSQDAINGLVIVVLSMILGFDMARGARMPDHGWKLSLVFVALLLSSYFTITRWPPKLGVDLSGGTILVYEVDQTKKEPGKPVDMDELLKALARRVNPGGQKEVTIRTYGPEQVEIILPQVSDEREIAQVEDIIGRAGTLEFRILANNRDHAQLIERARTEEGNSIKDSSGHELARWVPVAKDRTRELAYPEIATRTRRVKNEDLHEILVVIDPYSVTGQYLSRAQGGIDQKGQPCVEFMFNNTGGQLFGQLTASNLPDHTQEFTRKLGIILDGNLYSAPSIQSTITDRGEITGSFTQPEVDALVNVLTAGKLPAALNKTPLSRMVTGATLGADTIQQSTRAMLVASILVPIFMLWYYRFAGIVANIALILNMFMLLALMMLIHARFTLPGLAALALTVGMAVDNNVLVYERLREEFERGATLRMAIRNAFHRAGATIIDCNLTHLLAATVLYVIGSEQVKGFAVSLWLGCAISMFTAVFVAHVVFDIAEKQQWVTRLKMMHIIRHTNVDFMHWFKYCAWGSGIVTAGALVIAGLRGQSLFDIDFTGGVSIQAYFREPQELDSLRTQLNPVLPDLAISDITFQGEQRGRRININTSESDLDKVQKQLKDTFGDKLVVNAMSTGKLESVTAKSESAPAKPAADKDKPAQPEKKDQSRNDLPPESMLAMADGLPGMIGQALPTADANPVQAKPEAAKSEPAKPAAPAPATAVKTRLTFELPVPYKTVEELLTSAVETTKAVPTSTTYDITNEEFEGGNQAFKDWDIKIETTPEKAKILFDTMAASLKATPYFPASTQIGAAVAGGTRVQAIWAIVASWALMILYLWIRFQRVAFGLSAVIALVHDVLVMLGAIAISWWLAKIPGVSQFLLIDQFKINLPIVAAFLTIVGYSVNDTIVIFDRIREVRGKDPNLTRKMVNDSTNQTLSRTLLTSFTVFLVVTVMYVFGGPALRGFSFALLIGVITGTYSSIYVAAPILLWLIGSPGAHPAAAPVEKTTV